LLSEAGREAGSAQQRSCRQNAASERRCHLKANAKRSSGRSGRSEAQERRSGGRMLRIRLDLTATGRCGRGPLLLLLRLARLRLTRF
jgi:hypothetical protein